MNFDTLQSLRVQPDPGRRGIPQEMSCGQETSKT
jgi:hypothetical protein